MKAQVHSTEEIEAFRAKLVVFVANLRRTLGSAMEEVRSVQGWVQNDRQLFWQAELKRRTKTFERCKEDYYANPHTGDDVSSRSVRRMAMDKARQAVDVAEDKLRKIKRYRQEFEKLVGGQLTTLESVGHNVTGKMQEAIHYLANIEKALDAYKEMPSTGSDLPVNPAPSTEPAKTGGRTMSISGAALPEFGKQISIAWETTREKWRDAKAAEFEKRFMEDLPGELKRAAVVIEELDKILKKVRSDCE